MVSEWLSSCCCLFIDRYRLIYRSLTATFLATAKVRADPLSVPSVRRSSLESLLRYPFEAGHTFLWTGKIDQAFGLCFRTDRGADDFRFLIQSFQRQLSVFRKHLRRKQTVSRYLVTDFLLSRAEPMAPSSTHSSDRASSSNEGSEDHFISGDALDHSMLHSISAKALWEKQQYSTRQPSYLMFLLYSLLVIMSVSQCLSVWEYFKTKPLPEYLGEVHGLLPDCKYYCVIENGWIWLTFVESVGARVREFQVDKERAKNVLNASDPSWTSIMPSKLFSASPQSPPMSLHHKVTAAKMLNHSGPGFYTRQKLGDSPRYIASSNSSCWQRRVLCCCFPSNPLLALSFGTIQQVGRCLP